MTEPWTPDELAELAQSTAADMHRDVVANPSLVGATYGRTDYDNARRLALYEAANMRYVNDLSEWYTWRDVRWHKAMRGHLVGVAARVALRIGEEIAHIEDDDERGRHAAWAQQSLSETRLHAIVSVAAGIPDLHVNWFDFD